MGKMISSYYMKLNTPDDVQNGSQCSDGMCLGVHRSNA